LPFPNLWPLPVGCCQMTTYVCFALLTNWTICTNDAIHSWWRKENSLVDLLWVECSYIHNGVVLIWALFLWMAWKFLPLVDRRYSLPYKHMNLWAKSFYSIMQLSVEPWSITSDAILGYSDRMLSKSYIRLERAKTGYRQADRHKKLSLTSKSSMLSV
jgi:hypothetical protein